MYRYIYLYIIIYIYIIARVRACVYVCARELCKHIKVSLGDVMLLKLFPEPLYCRAVH